MAKKRIVKDKDGKQVEIDQDAIDAALAGAVTNADGSHPKNNEKPFPVDYGKANKDDKHWYAKENLEVACKEPSDEEIKPDENEGVADEGGVEIGEFPARGETPPVALSQQEFVKACYDLDINAKQCKYQSSKVEDKSIVEYIRSINKKIYDETQKGGYSTNIQFRVTPQDWVNVNHIFDWYKIRGFQVDVKETTTAPYGKEVGTMNYNFSISWSDA